MERDILKPHARIDLVKTIFINISVQYFVAPTQGKTNVVVIGLDLGVLQ